MTTPDLEALREEILDLHKQTIRAHLDKDVEFFTKEISDDYMSVGRDSPSDEG